MNLNRLAPLAAVGFVVAFVLANLVAAAGTTPIHGPAHPGGPVVCASAGTCAAAEGLTAIEDEALSRRVIARTGHAGRRAATSPTSLLATDESIRFASSSHVELAPPLERPLARRAVDVFTIRGPPLG